MLHVLLGILEHLAAVLVGGVAVWISPKIVNWWKERAAKRRFKKLFTAHTRLIKSDDKNANWDAEAQAACERWLDDLGIKHKSSSINTLAELWSYLSDIKDRAVNLILLGSPVRLQLAQDFLSEFEQYWFEKGQITLIKSELSADLGLTKSLAAPSALDGVYPLPKDNKHIHPVTLDLRSSRTFDNLIWPGIRIEHHQSVLMFPKYPFEASLKGATFRGYEHALVIVMNGQIRLPGQPGDLSIARIVMLMGYSGPSTLAAAEAFFSDPELFEPKKGPGAMLSVLEVPVSCDMASSKDIRYVPCNSIRLIWQRSSDGRDGPLKAHSLPYQLFHPLLQLSDANQVGVNPIRNEVGS